MNPVWLVRSRQMLTRFRFWIILTGYDPRDHSIAHKIYLVYASIFWSIWVFAVLGLAASGVAAIFQLVNPGHAADTAIVLEELCLLGWALYSAFSAARRSPIVFSEDDAYLICLTPVDRRQVTLAWLLGDWPYAGIPFWVLGSILGFTMMEMRVNGHASVLDYLSAALICISVIIPAHFGLMASVWAFGASRLQAEKEKTGLVWAPILAGALVALAWMIHSGRFAASGWISFLSEPALALLLLPVRASLGAAGWGLGELAAFAWVGVGLAGLVSQSERFNLSRAAQETSQYSAHRNALTSLNQDTANEISVKQKLGVEQPPMKLPIPRGSGALVWKDLVQAMRGLQLSTFLVWVQLLGAALGIFFAQDWGLRLVSLFFWILFSNQIFSQRLRLDLKNWAIFTQFPFDPLRLMLMEIGLPVAGSILINWAALGLTSRAYTPTQLAGMFLLIPGMILGMALVTTWDVLRQCESAALLAGIVPGVDIWSFVVGALGILVPLGMFVWLVGARVLPPFPTLGAMLVNLVILSGLLGLVKSSYRNIE